MLREENSEIVMLTFNSLAFYMRVAVTSEKHPPPKKNTFL